MNLTETKNKLQSIAPEFTDDVLELLLDYMRENSKLETDQLIAEMKCDVKFNDMVSAFTLKSLNHHTATRTRHSE